MSLIEHLDNYLELITYGFTNPMPDSNEGPWKITAKDVINGKINYDTARKTTIDSFENDLTPKSKPKINDILLTKDGTLGRLAIVDQENICVNQSVAVLRPNKKIIPQFLYYLLSSPYYQKTMLNDSDGSVLKHIYITRVKKMDVQIPDLTHQKKIIQILEFIDNKIDVLIKLNKNLLSIADAIYKKEFQNFDTYSEDELIASDFGLIPKNWHYKTLDEISDVGIGKTPPRKETWWFSEQEGVKWVSIKDLGNSGTYIFETSEYLTNEAIEKFNVKLIPINTVILSFKLTVGRIGITTEEMVTNEAIAHFKLSENSVITKEYLYLYLKNFNYEELGSTSSIAKAINSKIVKKIPILIPNNKINEFKDLFENLFNKIKSNQLEINKLTKLRDTLLPKLMSGEIDVSKINCDLE